MGAVLNGQTGVTFKNNTVVNQVPQVYNSNWNIPFISNLASGGTISDTTTFQTGNFYNTNGFDAEIVKHLTTITGVQDTIYADAINNRTTINAPQDLVENGDFSVNSIVLGTEIADQTIPSEMRPQRLPCCIKDLHQRTLENGPMSPYQSHGTIQQARGIFNLQHIQARVSVDQS